jgi:uncharacterized protein (UPF0303 family)
MTIRTDAQALVSRITDQDRSIRFERFDYDDAFQLGSRVLASAKEAGQAVAVSIMFGQQRVFHGARPGTNAANDEWLDRKLRVVAKFDAPSMLLQVRFQAMGLEFDDVSRLDPRVFAASGGGFPLRVRGLLIGAIAVSGLTDLEDHDLAVAALESTLAASA